jgi:uncharacterized protein
MGFARSSASANLRSPMDPTLFSVNVSDIEREEQEREWPIPLDWLDWALQGTEATHTGKTGRLTAILGKNGREFLVRGQVRVEVSLPCARTLEAAVYDLKPELFLLLVRQALPNDGPHRARQKAKPVPAEEPALDESEAAEDTFSGDALVLDRFVREQVLLELPMLPLRSDLRSDPTPAIRAAPQSLDHGSAVDPRLAPLKAIADRLRGDEATADPVPPKNKKK